MEKFFQSLRVICVITLFFFIWSYLPLYQLAAYAATLENQRTKAQGRKAEKQKPAEKLEKLLDDLRENTSKAEEKVTKGADTTPEIESIKARKADLDAIDTDLRKDLAATEQKLKSANLPNEILTRHYKFVKNYEDNLAELKANIDSIEKAKTPSALTSEIAKTQKHLSKIKPLKKRKPFDPNKLPNRIVKAKERQPKLKREEWDQEFKKSKKKPQAAYRQTQKPILVASNGPLSGLLSGSALPESNLQLANQTLDSIIQNTAVGVYSGPYLAQPTPEDMLETPETHITDAIRAKAAEFKNKPVPMFNWLWNNMYFVPSYGSIQGADMCLQTMQCNATDIASLTIALFRAAGFPARYEFSTKELEINRFMETMGGFTDPMAAITFVASGGVPVRPVISGGKITAVQFEHVYASAWIPYGNYRGLMIDNTIPTWVPLDFTIKHYVETPGIDLNTAVPFDAQSFVNQIQSTATINETEGYVTNVNSALIQQTMQDYQTRVQDYITQNTPTATVGDVIGKRVIKQEKFPFLPDTTWAKDVAAPAGGQSHTLPDSMLSSISFNIPDPSGATSGLSYSTSLPQIAGKKITLSFSPATAADQAVVASYTSASGSISSLPAYLINLTPELRIDDQVVATGSSITMATELSFTISLNEPGIGPSHVDNIILAGEYFGIEVDTGGMSSLDALKAKLEATKAKVETQNVDGLSKDDIVGDLLYATIASYFIDLDTNDEITARSTNVVRYRAPSIGMTSLKLDVRGIFNIPTSAESKGIMMDVDRIMQGVFSKDGNMNSVKQYMLSSGIVSSMLEHSVPERLYSQPTEPVNAMSAAKALKLANDQGIPIYTVNQSNISSILPVLQVGAEVKSDISNAVNAGKIVIIPKSSIVFNDWIGYGYIIIDPVTGAGAYMISSGSSGAWVILGLIAGTLALFGIALIAGWFFVAAGVIAALIGAVLVGLATVGAPYHF